MNEDKIIDEILEEVCPKINEYSKNMFPNRRKISKEEWDELMLTLDYSLKECSRIAIQKSRDNTKKEIMDIINQQRDNGNIENGGWGFSPALCLSEVIKYLEKTP